MAHWSRGQVLQPLARVADAVLDPSIVFSFDQTGFLRHRLSFREDDLKRDLSGRRCLVTGGNSGLGRAVAEGLAARGATVWVASRDIERSKFTCDEIRRATGNLDVAAYSVDLSDMRSVDNLVAALPSGPIDVLVNNAGVLLGEQRYTAEGVEHTLAANLLGHLRLTAALVPRLREGARARVIWVSSGGMYAKRLSVHDLKTPQEPFDGVAVYAQTKRAMVTLSRLLADRLAPLGIAVHSMHPGWAATPGVQQSLPVFWRLTRPILRTPEAGADTVLWLAVCDEAMDQSGRFWFDRQPRSEHLLARTRHGLQEERVLWAALHEWAGLNPTVWSQTEAIGLAV